MSGTVYTCSLYQWCDYDPKRPRRRSGFDTCLSNKPYDGYHDPVGVYEYSTADSFKDDREGPEQAVKKLPRIFEV